MNKMRGGALLKAPLVCVVWLVLMQITPISSFRQLGAPSSFSLRLNTRKAGDDTSFKNDRLLNPSHSSSLLPSVTYEGKQQRRLPSRLMLGLVPPSAAAMAVAAFPPLGSLLVLALIVLVHEAGHYLAAKSFGITVEEFSIGVGPKLFGIEAGNEFNVRALPLGGYVRFPENYNATLVREMELERMKEEETETAKLQQRNDKDDDSTTDATTSFGRQVLNVLSFGQSEQQRRKQDEERKRLQEEQELKSRPWWKRSVVVSSLRADSASRGLLQPGDVIVGINGYAVALSDSRNAQAAQQSISNLISIIRETPEGQSVQLSVVRPPLAKLPPPSLSSPVTSLPKPVKVNVQPQPIEGMKGPQSIGVMLSPNFVKTARLHSDSWIEASQLAAQYVGEITSETTSGLVTLVSQVVRGQGAPAGQQVSGPIGLIRTGSEVVATKDWNSVVIFAAIISINLAVVNALPLPALDGGQLVFVLAEALSGRKVDQRLQESITSVALLVLLLASASFAVGDVQNLLTR